MGKPAMTHFRRAFDITDPVIAWRLVMASWIGVILLMFPALTLTWRGGGLAPMTAIGAIPLLAVFLANMILSGGVMPPRLIASLAIHVTGWLMSGLTGYALGHA